MLGVFLSTADSYVIITNILKTKDSEEQQNYFKEKDRRGDDLPYLLQCKAGCEIST